jgi:hypothetical protein
LFHLFAVILFFIWHPWLDFSCMTFRFLFLAGLSRFKK